MTARTPFCRCLSQRRLESDDGGSATFLGQQAFRFCGGEAGRASRSLVPEERTGFGPRRPWLSVLAGRRSACGDSTRAAAVSPLKSRPEGPGFARGCWPAMVGADGETLAGHVPGAGVVESRVARTPPRSSRRPWQCADLEASPESAGLRQRPGQLPGGRWGGHCSDPGSWSSPPASRNTLGREGPPALGAAGFGFGFFPPRRGLPASPGTHRGDQAALGLRRSPCLCLPSGPAKGGHCHAQPVCLFVVAAPSRY